MDDLPDEVARLTADAAEFQPTERHDHPMYGKSGSGSPEFYDTPGERGTPAGACGIMDGSRIVGDNVTGMPRAGEAFKDTDVVYLPDLVTGDNDMDQVVEPSYVSVKDFPDGKGAGDEPLQPGGQFGK